MKNAIKNFIKSQVVYGVVVFQPPTHYKMSSNMKVILGTMEMGRRKLIEDAPVRQT